MHTREFEIVSRGNSRCKIPAIWAGLAVFGLASLTQFAEYPRFFLGKACLHWRAQSSAATPAREFACRPPMMRFQNADPPAKRFVFTKFYP